MFTYFISRMYSKRALMQHIFKVKHIQYFLKLDLGKEKKIEKRFLVQVF